jgi:Glycine-rich domain-containing protein-like
VDEPRENLEILLQNTRLKAYVDDTNNPSWASLMAIMNSGRKPLGKLIGNNTKHVSRNNIVSELRKVYRGITWRELSIDLVAACLRQRIYTSRVINECTDLGSPSALSAATSRYTKFLFLMNNIRPRSGNRGSMVPTLDIDLCWHTHQLYPQSYHEWCLNHLGRRLNHDDTIEKEVASQGIRATSLAWLGVYNEPYTTNDLRKEYFTPARKVAGIIFPLYGLFTLNMGQKLDRAREGNSSDQSLCLC